MSHANTALPNMPTHGARATQARHKFEKVHFIDGAHSACSQITPQAQHMFFGGNEIQDGLIHHPIELVVDGLHVDLGSSEQSSCATNSQQLELCVTDSQKSQVAKKDLHSF